MYLVTGSYGLVGLAYYSIAPLTILLAHFLLGERFTQLQAGGAVVIIFAAIISLSSKEVR